MYTVCSVIIFQSLFLEYTRERKLQQTQMYPKKKYDKKKEKKQKQRKKTKTFFQMQIVDWHVLQDTVVLSVQLNSQWNAALMVN